MQGVMGLGYTLSEEAEEDAQRVRHTTRLFAVSDRLLSLVCMSVP